MDFKDIKRLVELMSQNDLTELEVEREDMRISLKRGPQGGHPVVAPHAYAPAPAAPAPAPAAAPASPAAASKPAADHLDSIKSPMVGTFYRSSSPEAQAFVKVGDKVSPDTTVCIIEAMKVMNEIKAEKAGVIREICVENTDTVEFGQVLFKIEKA
ncbi:MAG: acetyl-CoA carboxylase biotin carboxyl carrier protein [Kiritimatiellia bacterium]